MGPSISSGERVCLVVNKYYHNHTSPSGVDNYLLQEEIALQQRNWQIVPFATLDNFTRDTPWREYFPRGRDYSSARLGKNVFLDAVNYVWNREAARQLGRMLTQFQPAVAHLHNIYHHLTPSILTVLTRNNIPIVLTVHDHRLLCPAIHPIRDGRPCDACAPGHYAPAVRWSCVKGSRLASILAAFETWHQNFRRLYHRHVDTFICPSRYLAQRLAAQGFPVDRIAVLLNPVDLEEWRPREVGFEPDGSDSAGVPRDSYAYFGRLAPEKGITDLLTAHALHEAEAGEASLSLTLIGSGPSECMLRDLSKRLRLRRCQFVGALDGPTLRKQLRHAKFTVLPSRVPENAPLALLESLASGLPVIGTELGGIPELISPGKTGWLVPANDPAALARAIACGSQSTPKMRRTCRAWAEAHIDSNRHFAQLNEILTTAVRVRGFSSPR